MSLLPSPTTHMQGSSRCRERSGTWRGVPRADVRRAGQHSQARGRNERLQTGCSYDAQRLMGNLDPQVHQCGQQLVGEHRLVLRPGPHLTLARTVTMVMAFGLAAGLSVRSELRYELAREPLRDNSFLRARAHIYMPHGGQVGFAAGWPGCASPEFGPTGPETVREAGRWWGWCGGGPVGSERDAGIALLTVGPTR